MGVDAGVLETAVLVAGVAGTAVSAYGAYEAGQAQKKAANYQAQVAANNAQIAAKNAQLATQKGEIEATQQQLKNRAEMGAIVSSMAANNVDVGSGSASDVRQSADILGNLDTSQIRSNAALENYGYRSQGMSFQAQQGLDQATAKFSNEESYIGATGSLLGGASRVGGQYINWQTATAGGGQGSTYGP